MGNDGRLLQLIGVTKRFTVPGGEGGIVVLDNLSLDAAAGESVAVIGPSGSGKSTLLHLIGSLDRPDAGQVLLEGQDLGTLDGDSLARVRNEKIGFVFQAHYLLPQCSAIENVLVPTLAGKGERERANGEGAVTRARSLLERLGLGDRLDHRPGQLSGGERQRVAVARALIKRPRLLLADEPTGSLDQASANELATLLVELNRAEGTTLIVVTHSAELAARASRVLLLKAGQLIDQRGHPTRAA